MNGLEALFSVVTHLNHCWGNRQCGIKPIHWWLLSPAVFQPTFLAEFSAVDDHFPHQTMHEKSFKRHLQRLMLTMERSSINFWYVLWRLRFMCALTSSSEVLILVKWATLPAIRSSTWTSQEPGCATISPCHFECHWCSRSQPSDAHKTQRTTIWPHGIPCNSVPSCRLLSKCAMPVADSWERSSGDTPRVPEEIKGFPIGFPCQQWLFQTWGQKPNIEVGFQGYTTPISEWEQSLQILWGFRTSDPINLMNEGMSEHTD